MKREYYFWMLSLAVVVAAFVSIGAALAGHLAHLPHMYARIALVLLVVNAFGAHLLLMPVARYLDDQADFASARGRIENLALWSAVLAFGLVLSLMLASFYIEHKGGGTIPQSLDAGYPLALLVLFSLHMSLYIYFVVGDYVTRLKMELHARGGARFQPGRRRISHKLLLAFAATSLIPAALLAGHSATVGGVRQMFGIQAQQALMIDAMTAAFLSLVAVLSMTRYLIRPLRALVGAVEEIGRGRLGTRAPVVSDDELGVLAARVNAMAEGLADRDFLHQTLGRFVPQSVADTVLSNRGLIRPQVREATILFTDIEGFTSIAERLAPERIIAMLNAYFEVAADPMHDHGGTITQFQGDAMLVSFNLPVEDPDHAASALRAALSLQSLLREREFEGRRLNTRIGIATGEVVGGTVGDASRLGYTVHGNEVNLAARLEALNKELGTRTLVAARTAALAGPGFPLSEVGTLGIRGRSEPLTVYSLRHE